MPIRIALPVVGRIKSMISCARSRWRGLVLSTNVMARASMARLPDTTALATSALVGICPVPNCSWFLPAMLMRRCSIELCALSRNLRASGVVRPGSRAPAAIAAITNAAPASCIGVTVSPNPTAETMIAVTGIAVVANPASQAGVGPMPRYHRIVQNTLADSAYHTASAHVAAEMLPTSLVQSTQIVRGSEANKLIPDTASDRPTGVNLRAMLPDKITKVASLSTAAMTRPLPVQRTACAGASPMLAPLATGNLKNRKAGNG